MRLTNEQKDAVRRLLSLTETKQFALSSLSGLSPSVVSEMTNPARDRDIQAETWRKFVAGLEMVIGNFKAKTSDPQIVVEVGRLLGDVLQEEVKPFLDEGGFVQDPGGWIASPARNYIERPIDRAFEQYLTRTTAAMVSVSGPVQSGRSSAVRRLVDRAEAKGFAADFVDLQDVVDLNADAGWTADKVARRVLEQLDIDPPKGGFGKADFAAEATQALLRGQESRTLRVRRAFLILDSFDVLARTVIEAAEVDLLSRWLTALRTTLPTQPPFERMTLVLVANAPEWSLDGVMSSFISHSRQLPVGKFNDGEVGRLFSAYDMGTDEFMEARAYALSAFAGHPFLIHTLAAELSFGTPLSDVKGMVTALDGDFGRHWRQIFRTVCRFYRDRTEPETHAGTLLRRAVTLVDNAGGGDISAAELRFLRAVGVLDSIDPPRLCGFYRHAIATQTRA